MSYPARMSKVASLATWTLRIVLAGFFLSTGYRKLTGDPAMTLLFEQMGTGLWLQYLIGGIEIVAGVFVLVPMTGVLGGLLITGAMVCAAVVSLTIQGVENPLEKFTLSLILLVMGAFVAWQSRPHLRDEASSPSH
ncbi:DoxX family protein [Roseiarcaceae bacterium H3SJ34-1]|uniref:DoxX family protein n=1 Tax=Terripilifer ovatus TaxID=3032367 RepID=UPI003AB94DDB|nr:DoxX family protein [Roseiarcaceae bacterium H3SJ34-1]